MESHRRIYQALCDRDSEKAAREMLNDVVRVENELAKLSKKGPCPRRFSGFSGRCRPPGGVFDLLDKEQCINACRRGDLDGPAGG
jgi:hypothetical protein